MLYKKSLNTVLVGLAIALSLPAKANEEFNWLAGLKVSGKEWQGQNTYGEESNFKQGFRQWTLWSGYQKGRWFGSASLGLGQAEFGAESPDFAPAENYSNLGELSVGFGELDLGFGYRVWNNVYPIFGFKRYGMNYQKESNEVSKDYSGFSVGLGASYPIGSRFRVFGSLANETLNVLVDEQDIGDARGTAIELGAAWYLSSKSLISLSAEAHGLEDTYSNGAKQTHNVAGLTLSFQRRFGR